jgi:hypothetical protein
MHIVCGAAAIDLFVASAQAIDHSPTPLPISMGGRMLFPSFSSSATSGRGPGYAGIARVDHHVRLASGAKTTKREERQQDRSVRRLQIGAFRAGTQILKRHIELKGEEHGRQFELCK